MGGHSSFRIAFSVSLFMLLASVIVVSTLGSVGSVVYSSTDAARDSAAGQFAATAGRVQDRVEHRVSEALDLASAGASIAAAAVPVSGDGLDHPLLPFLMDTLNRRPTVYSLYVGYSDGTFLQAIANDADDLVARSHDAPAATDILVRTITGQGADRIERWTYLDADRRVIGRRVQSGPPYDPRQRSWYGAAQAVPAATLTQPYLFASSGLPGLSGARRLLTGGGVFGVDLSLVTLTAFVQSLEVSSHGGVVLLDEAEHVLAARHGLLGATVPPLSPLATDSAVGRAIHQALAAAPATTPVSVMDGGEAGPVLIRLGRWQGGSGAVVTMAVAAPLGDFSAPFDLVMGRLFLLGAIILALVVPLALLVSRRLSLSLRRLVAEAERIRSFDFSDRPLPQSVIREFHDLGQAFGLMRHTLSDRSRALEVEQDKLERLISQGIAMAAERDGVQLMQMILEAAKELTNADGGTLYIRDGDGLRFQILRNDSLGIALGGAGDPPCDLPPVPLFTADGRPNHANVVSHCLHDASTVNIPDAYDATTFDFSGTRVFDEHNGYRSTSFLTVPLKPRGGAVIGALQLINARDEDGAVQPFAEDIQSMVEALAAQAGTLMDNHALLEAQENLLDSLIRIIAGSIDAKSPYTGGHCARVPELALMLAEEASGVRDGPLGDFAFRSETEWREFRIGAWLHDCGKVVTPEYVVDKATKLETIHNRIHDIRTRFEVLHRDATITYLAGVLEGTTPEPELRAARDRRHAELQEQFTFVAACNIGSESMEEDNVRRLEEIAVTPWQRHFDDRLGLSHLERERFGPSEPLPATEALLADKPWHVIPRPGGTHAYDAYDFKVTVPQDLYNFGELYNLCIRHGTLTEEERFKINEHIMQTIAMLEDLPFPEHLKRVPEYAGTHHETLTGTGYPRALTGDDLSVPARIMAIADIFEALTASDRPYKTPKTLSESIDILSGFRDRGHIDPDLFDLFLTSGIYRRYGDRFLAPDQIDAVDITPYLSEAARAAYAGPAA